MKNSSLFNHINKLIFFKDIWKNFFQKLFFQSFINEVK